MAAQNHELLEALIHKVAAGCPWETIGLKTTMTFT
jgi:hypothetical protein